MSASQVATATHNNKEQIAIAEFTGCNESTVRWQLVTRESDFAEPDAQHGKLLLMAIGFSLLLHTALAVAFIAFSNEARVPQKLSSVRINLMPNNPLQAVTAPLEDIAEELITPVAREEGPVAPLESPAENTVELEAPAIESIAELPAPVSVPATVRSEITLPSAQSVLQTIQAVSTENAARSWLYDCNDLEEEAGLRTCEPRTADYRVLERNSSYEALNPVREFTRTRRTLTTVYQHADAVAGALNTSAISPELAGYVLSELEAGTSVYTNNGTDRLQHMQRMIDQSAAAKQAERVLGDAWVRGRAVELQQRKVHVN